MARTSSSGKLRDATCAANRPQHIASGSTDPTKASSDTFDNTTSTSARAPKAPTRESFMMTSARSRSLLPPRPSATSARPSSWNAPVSRTPSTVPSTATTSGAIGAAGNSANSAALAIAMVPPTSHPTPGKCAALARNIAGL